MDKDTALLGIVADLVDLLPAEDRHTLAAFCHRAPEDVTASFDDVLMLAAHDLDALTLTTFPDAAWPHLDTQWPWNPWGSKQGPRHPCEGGSDEG